MSWGPFWVRGALLRPGMAPWGAPLRGQQGGAWGRMLGRMRRPRQGLALMEVVAYGPGQVGNLGGKLSVRFDPWS